jgi:exopolysaccharide biosynthesis polyprenyl glycosylphosphotransferase
MEATINAGGSVGTSIGRHVDVAGTDGAGDDGSATAPVSSSAAIGAAGPVAVGRDRAADQQRLQWYLRIGDGAAILLGFLVMAVGSGYHRLGDDRLGFTLATATCIGLWAIRFEGLWNERILAMRTIEISRLTRAIAILTVGMLVVDRLSRAWIHVEHIAVAVILTWLFLLGWRSFYRAWLASNRRRGRYTRRLVIVGTDRRAVELAKIFAIHPEAGMRLGGLIGSRAEATAAGLGDVWQGDYRDADDVLAAIPADVVVICSSDISPLLLNSLLRDRAGAGPQLYFHPGLSGIDARRVKASPIAHEPLLYVESASLSRTDGALKRAFDIAVASTLLLVFSPVFVTLALLVKFSDKGPIFFRQERVGRGDSTFGMLKFRSMVVDAEARLAALEDGNQRKGPLFKLNVDPRVTRVGRLLRASSLDELPQLINVVKGDMSLVGPRPALPSEVAEFPLELRERHRVRPGITGLWQVEARDNPSFDAYQRLDLFYVENWSLALDMVLMLATAEQLLLRPVFNRTTGEMAAAEPASDPAVA